ncbi:hypothetical protein [Streptomyces sp. NPDC003717]|uniref:hypothetical protein n=1 Tax=Streptomyces sp. NPDC003717 TaxID=3154276 RepID=UPI0033B9E3BD
MSEGEFQTWTRRFERERERRRAQGDPDWHQGATLPPPVWAGIQRFQIGEDGDGANLIAKADRAGDPAYASAVRLFVAEEQNHARLLAALLAAGGRSVIAGHWTDTAFIRLRRLLGLRLELLVLMIAEVVALHYYRALRDGTHDALTSEVAARIPSRNPCPRDPKTLPGPGTPPEPKHPLPHPSPDVLIHGHKLMRRTRHRHTVLPR